MLWCSHKQPQNFSGLTQQLFISHLLHIFNGLVEGSDWWVVSVPHGHSGTQTSGGPPSRMSVVVDKRERERERDWRGGIGALRRFNLGVTRGIFAHWPKVVTLTMGNVG